MTQISKYNRGIRYLFSQKEIRKKIDDTSLADLPPNCRAETDERTGKIIWKMDLSETPLVFKIISHQVISQIELLVSFKAEEDNDKLLIRQYQLEIKLWSNKPDFCYRENYDSSRIKKLLESREWKRVMLRFHLDKKGPDVTIPEPNYHLHVGGDQSIHEYCWIPEAIEEPRIPHPPMDVVLLLEYLLVNYFPTESQDFRNKREWIDIVKFSERLFQERYFEDCRNLLQNDSNTLLGHHCSMS